MVKCGLWHLAETEFIKFSAEYRKLVNKPIKLKFYLYKAAVGELALSTHIASCEHGIDSNSITLSYQMRKRAVARLLDVPRYYYVMWSYFTSLAA